ncbi:MAG: hypothetical protein NTV74_04775 [Euryarchaeota archaeon]|jgi:hypothetical protein|nr:hypothetical protein [Euryarchaeota archaeon]
MNKTLIAVGVGIWGVMLILNFILSSSLEFLGPQKRIDILFPLTLIEIIAFIITMVGIFRKD